MVCLDHVDHLCRCKFHQRSLRYQLTVEELDGLLSRLKDRSEAGDRWKRMVQGVVSEMDTDCGKPGWWNWCRLFYRFSMQSFYCKWLLMCSTESCLRCNQETKTLLIDWLIWLPTTIVSMHQWCAASLFVVCLGLFSLDMTGLKNLINEAFRQKLPDNDELQLLMSVVQEAEKLQATISQITGSKIRTRWAVEDATE